MIKMNVSIYPEWSKENSYNQYDKVRYMSTLYIAIENVPAGTEINDASKWLLIYINNTKVNHEAYQMLMIQKAESGSGVTVDQTYQPESANAAAGKAVSQALSAYRPYYDSGVVSITDGFDIRNLNQIITCNFKDPMVAPVASDANAFKTWPNIRIPDGFIPLEDIFVPVFFDGQLGQIKINTSNGSIQQKAPFAITVDMPVRGVMSWTV